MGAAFWLASALLIFGVARIIPPGRERNYLTELTSVVLAAAACGLGATALDFGGWKELDWRAIVFVALGAAAAVGAQRAVLIARS